MSRPATTAVQTFTAPATADNVSVLAAQTLPSTGTTVISTGFTNPTNARTIRFKGNQATVQGLVVSITGTDFYGNVISENVTMGASYATPTDTVNAYATVTSITFPTRGASGDTISVGRGAALGLDNYCNADSFGSKSSITSFTYSTTILALNTVVLTQSLDGVTNQYATYHPALFYSNNSSRA